MQILFGACSGGLPGLGVQQAASISCPGSGNAIIDINARLHGIRFLANNTYRAQLYHYSSTSTINGYSGIDRDGHFGLSGRSEFFTSGSSPGPLSRFYLVDGIGSNTASVYAPTLGFRDWMRNGITFTGNSDQMYIGHKYGASDGQSQAVVQWSEGSLDANRQALRFIFTTTPTTGSGAVTSEGLEIMRLWPESNTSGHVGIGDFATASASPTERLDLVDGNLRVRALPGSSATSDDKVVVVDANGVFHWRDASTLGAPGCQWSMNTTTPHHVSTAFGAASATCPDEDEAVGIGVDLASTTPIAKVMMESAVYDTTVAITASTSADRTTGMSVTASGGAEVTKGINVDVEGGSDQAIGVLSHAGTDGELSYGGLFVAEGSGSQSIGVQGIAYDGADHCVGIEGHSYGNGSLFNAGVIGQAHPNGTALTYYGVRGVVIPPDFGDVFNLYGVYGTSIDDSASFINSYAVYSEGRQASTSDVMWEMPSDEMLKENIEDLDNALTALMQLQPKKYNYRVDEFPSLHLTSRHQYGLLANEVEPVLPFLVNPGSRPAVLDAEGNEVTPAVEFKTMRYGPLLNLLIAGVKEQNASITALQQQVADAQTSADQLAAMQEQMQAMQQQLLQMQEQLAACCADGMAPQPGNEQRDRADEVSGDARALIISPNPFTDRTTLYCTLERGGRVQLLANSADGKDLINLFEGQREAGEFQHVWSTEQLAPGMYYVTLLLDGEPLVKRAGKVGR